MRTIKWTCDLGDLAKVTVEIDLPEDVVDYCLRFSNIHGYEMIRKRFGTNRPEKEKWYYYNGIGLIDDMDKLKRGIEQYRWRKTN